MSRIMTLSIGYNIRGQGVHLRYRVHSGCSLLQVSSLRLEVFCEQCSLTCLLRQVCVDIIVFDRGCMGNFGGKVGGCRAYGVRR